MRQELRGERTGIRHGAGSKLRVQVSRVDLDGRRIDFRLVAEGGGERLLARGRHVPAGTAVEELAAVRLRDREVKAAARSRKSGTARSAKRPNKTGTRPKVAAKGKGR